MHTLAIAITDNCPLRCSFCCVPPQPLDLDEDLLKHVVETAAVLKFKKIGFTGGEPLIRRKQLYKAAAIANEYGIPWGLTTGLGWTKKNSRAIFVANELCDFGINDITISIDPSHMKFTKLDVYLKFIETFINRSVPVLLSVTLFLHEREQFEKYLKTEVFSQLGNTPDNLLKTEFHYVAAVGFAAAKKGCGSTVKESAISDQMRCPMKGTFVFSVWPNGDVYPCCSTYVVNKTNELKIGNVKNTPFNEIVDMVENDPFFWMFSNLGFKSIVSHLSENLDFSELLKNEYNDACDLCSCIGTGKYGISTKTIRSEIYQSVVKS